METELIARKEIEEMTIDIEVISDTDSMLFGEYLINIRYKGSYITPKLVSIDEIKDVANAIVKAKTISELIKDEEINKMIISSINYCNWMQVAQEVSEILNFVLSAEEIDTIADGKEEIDIEDVDRILEYKAFTNKKAIVYEYENKNDLIRFVTQIFICNWLQSTNGIQLTLGEQKDINKITTDWNSIHNTAFDKAVKNGAYIRQSTEED